VSVTSTATRRRRVALPSWLWQHRVGLTLGVLSLVLAGLVVLLAFGAVVVNRFDGRRWNLPSRIYSDAFVLRPGDRLAPEALAARLSRLFYLKQTERPEKAGRFRRDKSVVEVFPRDFRYAGRLVRGTPVRVEFESGHVRSILDAAGPVSALLLEPELLGSVFGDELEDRRIVRLSEVPQALKDAVLTTEDRDFYRHPGVSVKRTIGALFATLRGSPVQGGSTLTQQLVKNLYLSPERTLKRKATEAIMAVILDFRYSKDEILEAYFNEIYLGQHGSISITGVGAAARYYFGKDIANLDLSECASIAAMIKAPNTYAPTRNAIKAKQRRDLVLRMMREEKKIDDEALTEAAEEDIPLEPLGAPRITAPHFLDFVKAELARRYGDKVKTEGLQVYTTLDRDLQQAGQEAVTGGLARLEKQYRRLAAAAKEAPLQGALIFLEPGTGAVRALVGGRDYRVSQFNRVTQARRQPGSLFKPFVYLAAFARREGGPKVTPATILEDSPITVEWEKKQADQQWTPRNYDGKFRGPMSARRALELSINIPAVRAALAAELPNVVAAARAAGFGDNLKPYPAMALGAFEISPIDIAAAYAVLANSGVRVEPYAIVGVETADGELLERKETPLSQALPADAVFLVDSVLKGAVERGTATGARAGGLGGVLAGKTGTTNDGRDAWFIGFSPHMLTAIWVGYDDNRGLSLSGSQAAVPIFADFSKSIPSQYFGENFPVPSDIVTAEIDPETGYLVTANCPQRMTEVFIHGTAPAQDCPVHAPRVAALTAR
jgi:penicillin-binding protein 1B